MICIKFNGITDNSSKRELDKLAFKRSIFEIFFINCQNIYSLREFEIIDKELEPFRGRCLFHQYIRSKPTKYRLKIIALVSFRTFYT